MTKENIDREEYKEIPCVDIIEKIFFEYFLLPYQPYIFIVHVGFLMNIEREWGKSAKHHDLIINDKKLIGLSGKLPCVMNVLLIADDHAEPQEIVWHPVDFTDIVEKVPKIYKQVRFISIDETIANKNPDKCPIPECNFHLRAKK